MAGFFLSMYFQTFFFWVCVCVCVCYNTYKNVMLHTPHKNCLKKKKKNVWEFELNTWSNTFQTHKTVQIANVIPTIIIKTLILRHDVSYTVPRNCFFFCFFCCFFCVLFLFAFVFLFCQKCGGVCSVFFLYIHLC